MNPPVATTSPVEDPRLETSKSLLSLIATRAGFFVQPDSQKRQPMTLAMALVINAIISISRLERAWPRNGRRYALPHFARASTSQSWLMKLINGIPILRYKIHLVHYDMLTDREMEEVRLFCILVDVIREVTGSSEADHGMVIFGYFQMCLSRQTKLNEDLTRFLHMYAEMVLHQHGVASIEGLVQEEGD